MILLAIGQDEPSLPATATATATTGATATAEAGALERSGGAEVESSARALPGGADRADRGHEGRELRAVRGGCARGRRQHHHAPLEEGLGGRSPRVLWHGQTVRQQRHRGCIWRALAGAKEIASKALERTQVPNIELVPKARVADLGALILRPHGFHPGKKYPVVLYVYGGPTMTMVHDTMAGYFIPHWIADHGFVVVATDGHGTPRRGRDFERALLNTFGSVPLDDQVKGLEALGASYPELDLTCVGVYGWSFGGYMAALSVLNRPDVFKVAVSGAPGVDWTYDDTHYTERYLGLPEKNPTAYAAAPLLTYAPKLERPLLLVHGIADDNVYFAHTLQLSGRRERTSPSREQTNDETTEQETANRSDPYCSQRHERTVSSEPPMSRTMSASAPRTKVWRPSGPAIPTMCRTCPSVKLRLGHRPSPSV